MGCCWKGQLHAIIKNREKGEEQLRSWMHIKVAAASGGVPTETGGRLLFMGSAATHPLPRINVYVSLWGAAPDTWLACCHTWPLVLCVSEFGHIQKAASVNAWAPFSSHTILWLTLEHACARSYLQTWQEELTVQATEATEQIKEWNVRTSL